MCTPVVIMPYNLTSWKGYEAPRACSHYYFVFVFHLVQTFAQGCPLNTQVIKLNVELERYRYPCPPTGHIPSTVDLLHSQLERKKNHLMEAISKLLVVVLTHYVFFL